MASSRNQPSLSDRRPLYDQVYRLLRTEIESGSLRPGDHLPSERTVADQMGVSRVTVRRALQQLADEGLIEGRRVASFSEPTNALLSFTAVARERGLTASAKVLVAVVRNATLDEADLLRIPPGGDVFELHRARYLGGIPIALDESHIPYELVPAIEQVDFTTASLYDTLEKEYGIVATRADYSIEAVGATAAEATLLDVDVGGPLLNAKETVYDQRDRPVDTGRIVYRGDRYRFRTTLVRML